MENIEDANLFMMCESPNPSAHADMPWGYRIRSIRPVELELWMAFPFDDPRDAVANRGYMERYFAQVYGGREDDFYRRCLMVVDEEDIPVATLFAWRAYGCVTTLHWFKVRKDMEGRGIGRALLAHVMNQITPDEYPVFLHTQPGSYRAIKLYADFGFRVLTDPRIGRRDNDWAASRDYLRAHLLPGAFERLATADAPDWFLRAVDGSDVNQF